MIEAGGLHFLAHHQIGVAQDVELFGGHFTQDPNRQAGAGEGMATDDFLGQAQGAAHLAYLVFKQAPQWFHQLELEILGQAADVVVALDLDGNPLAGFGIDVGARRLDHIGIEGALGQEIKGSEALAFFLKYPNKFGADDFTFLLGIGNAS